MIGVNISHSLILWALNFGISHSALTALLMILRHFGQKELPKHAKTLLKTPRTRISVRPCPPGEAFYYGIQNSLVNMVDSVFDSMDRILTDFFIDGITVSDSSSWEIWPIIGSFVGSYSIFRLLVTLRSFWYVFSLTLIDRMNINPYLVHAYAGPGKPKDVDNYLKEFCEEITDLEISGVQCGKSRVLKSFNIRAFICDSPAAAFTTGRIGHSSYHGCPKCDQICRRDEANSRLLYQTFAGNLRTDESFFYREDSMHHRPEFLERHSLLEQTGIGHVSQFVIDPMHLIDLGISKKLSVAIVDKVMNLDLKEMNERFLSFRPYVPSELERKPRTLKQVKKFKANEFKQMTSYTLPVLIKDFVEPQIYQAVLQLHVGIRLLQDPQNYLHNLGAAQALLDVFVQEYPDVFGVENFTFNTHCLIHVPKVVERFGSLYSFSAYRHENHQRILNRLLRKKSLHLQQLYNRFAEISVANEIEFHRMDKSFQYDSFILRANNLRDGCCMVKPGVPLEITGLIESDGPKIIRGRRYLRCENFFDYPVPSMENQGIILASTLSSVDEDFPAEDVLHKYFRLPYRDKFVLTPLLFTS